MVPGTSQPTGTRASEDFSRHLIRVDGRLPGPLRRARSDVPGFSPPVDLGGGRPRRRILLPYSGSATAELALDFVAREASTAGSEIWLLYVRIFDVARGGCYYLETQRQARACAQQAAHRLRTAGVACSCVTRNARRDKIVRTILAEAEVLDAELIILGARNRTRLGEIFLGSTSGAVARRSRRRVVLVRA